MSTMTADQHRDEAAAHRAASHESFERCDTDGFASQAAHDIMGRVAEARALIAENGGTALFAALFDLDGNLVPAKDLPTRYGYSWGLLATADTDAEIIGWFSPSKAQDPERARLANVKKGYYVGTVRAQAYATTTGGGHGFAGMASVGVATLRCDRGFSTDVEIIDNGHRSPATV